jgi:hypothetical protein
MAEVNNQVFISTKNIKKSELEKILKENIKEDFFILNFDYEGRYWLVDFNSDKAPKKELIKIF